MHCIGIFCFQQLDFHKLPIVVLFKCTDYCLLLFNIFVVHYL